jgi:VWFA-related protein
MTKKLCVILSILFFVVNAASQNPPQARSDEQAIRISTQLVQLDVVVTDKNGGAVRGLTKNDFELYEGGKKQLITFFEFVDAVKGQRSGHDASGAAPGAAPVEQPSGQGPAAADIRRIFAFVVDDLTIRYEDLTYLRQMLTNFVDSRMQPNDLVAIVRTVGGKGLLQQFTTDKALLRRAIASLTPVSHPFSAFHNPDGGRMSGTPSPASDTGSIPGGDSTLTGAVDTSGDSVDINSAGEDTTRTLRAYMSLGTASFLIDSMKQLPGRKSMILISGGLPILSANPGNSAGAVSMFLNSLSDRATRAGVAINTMDIRGLQASVGVASFTETPGKSSMGTDSAGAQFGRVPDETQFGYRNPFDTMEAHQGLRVLANETGGIAVLNKNNFDEGLGKIVGASDAYYLLAYTPADSNFKGDFRKVEIKVKNKDLKVLSRRGYFAREERPAVEPVTKQDQVLAAIKSPVARRDIDLEAMVLYKAAQLDKGAIDISIVVDPGKLQFEEVGGKQQASYDVVGFVFDELGKLRGGFNETINTSLTPDEFKVVIKAGGLPYTTTTTLPAGTYQIRLAVRDNKTEKVGTVSRYLEVPDLSKGRLAASSMLLGAAPPGEVKGDNPTPLSAARRISQKQDLRYAVVIYNPKLKSGQPQVQTQLLITQNGREIYKGPEEMIAPAGNSSQAIKFGQMGMSKVKPGRYTMTMLITDTLADKKANTITRSMDFVVVN